MSDSNKTVICITRYKSMDNKIYGLDIEYDDGSEKTKLFKKYRSYKQSFNYYVKKYNLTKMEEK